MSLFEDIGSHEGFKDNIYPDHAGVPTIGVGYNLRNEDVLKAILNQFGYSDATLPGEFKNLVDDLSEIFKDTTWTENNKGTKIKEVNEKLEEYKDLMTEANQLAAEDEFKFKDKDAVDAEGYGSTKDEMKPIFDEAIKDFEKQIVAEIKRELTLIDSKFEETKAQEIWDGLTQSQRNTLLSLAFNGGAKQMIGPKMATALRDKNWADAYYEIVYGSNKQKDFDGDKKVDGRSYGLQDRRIAEGAQFIDSLSIADKQKLYNKLKDNKATIEKYLDTVVDLPKSGGYKELSKDRHDKLFSDLNGLMEGLKSDLAEEGISVDTVNFKGAKIIHSPGLNDANEPAQSNPTPVDPPKEPKDPPVDPEPTDPTEPSTPPADPIISIKETKKDGYTLTEVYFNDDSGTSKILMAVPDFNPEGPADSGYFIGFPNSNNHIASILRNPDGTVTYRFVDKNGNAATDLTLGADGQSIDLTHPLKSADGEWIRWEDAIKMAPLPEPEPPHLPPPPPRDPLALDLSGDGVVNTLPISRGVHFDLDNSGFAERTSWIAPEDGLLVLDRNNNNFIDGGAELFGTETLLSNGLYAKHGFEALAEFDLNRNGAVDMNDAVYSSLRVWRDANSNGIADSQELKTLAELDIKSITTAHTNINALDANNVDHREAGKFTYNNSNQGITNTLWFESDRRITVPVTELQGNAPIPDAIKRLPNAIGFGNTYSLHQAMAVDVNGDLQKKVQRFSVELSSEKRRELLREILVLWTGTEGIAAGSRGNQVDATSLSIMESFWGQAALQNEPFGAYASSINEAYRHLEQSIYSQLMASTHMRDLLSLTDFNEVNGAWAVDYSVVMDLLVEDFRTGNEFAEIHLADFLATIRGIDPYSDTLYFPLISALSIEANKLPDEPRAAMLSPFVVTADTTRGSSASDLLVGLSGNNNIHGMDGNDLIIGGDNTDHLYGGEGNDDLTGSKGVDYLQGESGDDRYIFNRGDGVDIITDTSGNDTLVFGPGIAPADVVVHQSNGNFYFIINNGEMVQITGSIVDGSPAEATLLERVEFSGGVIWDKTIIQQKITETLENPNLRMGRNTWDHLTAGNSDSIVNGLGGDDQIYGGNGNDTLIGGSGLNFLDGGNGDDTYLITEQPASHFIKNFRNGFDRILFAEGITPEDITVKLIPGRQESHLDNGVLWGYHSSQADKWNFKITVGDTVIYLDSLLTSGALWGATIKDPLLPSGEIEFFNGIKWTANDLLQQAVKGTAVDNYITGSGASDVINGLAGNDWIYALNGADTLEGGEGDDTLTGGYGKDVLVGGKGNDLLLGDNSYKEISNLHEQIDDIYRFNRGDGNDTIQEYFGRDIIEFGAGINKEQVVLSTVGDDTVVSFLDSTDTITIKNGALPETQFYTGGKIEIFKFVNGDVLNFDPKMNPVFREGTANSDTLVGGIGNDTFIGHEGYDELKGDLGDDEYRYNLGDGFDYIDEAGGVDKIVFGSEITADMVQIKKSGFTFDIYVNNQKVLSFGYGPWTDSRTLEGNPDSLVESLVFANGDVWDLQMMIAKSLIYTAGDDVLSGTTNNDLISGGDGNDVIQAGAGNDTLTGGKGNDDLWGSLGDDVYQFDLAEGTDSIFEHGGNDTIQFGSGILPTDISVKRTETDLILNVKNAGQITVFEFFDSAYSATTNRAVDESSAIDNIVFANGDAWSRSQLLARLSVAGTSSANTLYGTDASELIDAREGNDSIFAGGGSDTLIGGSGNDTLHGEAGDDLLQGGDGADWLYDAYGSNIYVGGKGNDIISLSYSAIQQFAKQSTIRFGLGDGIDEIHTSTSNPVTIELGAGITPDMLAFKSYFVDKTGGSWSGADENRVDLLILGTSYRINKLLDNGTAYTLKFSDDTIWTAAQLKDAAKKSMAILSENRNILTGSARPNSKIYISYLNQNNSVTEYPVIQTDASGYYEFDFGFGIKDVSRIIISSKDANGYTLPITVFGPATDSSTPPAPIAELDATGYVITGFARPGAYVSVSTPNRHVGEIYSDLITGAFTIVSPTRLNNGENISVIARVNASIKSLPTIITAPDFVSPLTPSGVFDNLGNSLSGSAEKGAIVSITALSGDVLGSSVANVETGAFVIDFAQPVANGELIQMVVRDAAGNSSSRYVRAPDLTAPTTVYASVDKTGKIIKGFAEPGATVVVRDTQGALLRQVTTSAIDGAFEVALSSALTANQVVNIKVIDTAGNASAIIPITAGASNAPAQPQVAIDSDGRLVSGVSTEAGTIIVKSRDNVELARTSVQAGGSFNIPLSNSHANHEIFSVSLQIAGGTESAPSYFIAPDKMAPAKPFAIFGPYNFEITGFAEPHSTVQILNEDNSIAASAVASGTNGSFTIRPQFAISETARLSLVSIDRSGNVSSPLVLVPNDNVAPIAPTGSFNSVGKIVTGTAEPDALVYIEKYIFGSSNLPVVGYTRADQNGIWSIELEDSIIDGSAINIVSVDAGNNRSSVLISSPDITAPMPATAKIDASGKIITGGAQGSEVIVMDRTNTIMLGRVTLATYDSTYTITLPTALKSNESVNVFVKDLAGNLSHATAVKIPDTIAPNVPTANFDTAGKVISGTAEAGSDVVVKNADNTSTLGTVTANAITGVYSITLATALINKETVNVTASDAAGNVSVALKLVAPGATTPNSTAITIQAENYTSMSGVQTESTSEYRLVRCRRLDGLQ